MKKMILGLFAFVAFSNFASAKTAYFLTRCPDYDHKLAFLEVRSAGWWGDRSLAIMYYLENVYTDIMYPSQAHVTFFKKEISSTVPEFEGQAVLTEYNAYTTSDADPRYLLGRLYLFKPASPIPAGVKAIGNLDGVLVDERKGQKKIIGRFSRCVISEDGFSQGAWEG